MTDARSELLQIEAGFDPSAIVTDRARPIERSSRRRRNFICIGVIALGLLNLLAYTVVYAFLGGDAPNGARTRLQQADGSEQITYTVRGHFLRQPAGIERRVSGAVWTYSYLHSISVPLTSGLMIFSMLILARPHILATMRDSPVRGRVVIALFAGAVLLITTLFVGVFVYDFLRQMSAGA